MQTANMQYNVVCLEPHSVIEQSATSNCPWIQDDSLRRPQISNYKSSKYLPIKSELVDICTSRKLIPMRACSVCTISAIGAIQLDMLAANIREYSALYRPVF